MFCERAGDCNTSESLLYSYILQNIQFHLPNPYIKKLALYPRSTEYLFKYDLDHKVATNRQKLPMLQWVVPAYQQGTQYAHSISWFTVFGATTYSTWMWAKYAQVVLYAHSISWFTVFGAAHSIAHSISWFTVFGAMTYSTWMWAKYAQVVLYAHSISWFTVFGAMTYSTSMWAKYEQVVLRNNRKLPFLKSQKWPKLMVQANKRMALSRSACQVKFVH